MNYTKNDLLKHFGSGYRLAKFLKISHQAVNKWPADGPIPELRQLQLEKRQAEWLKPPRAKRRPRQAPRRPLPVRQKQG